MRMLSILILVAAMISPQQAQADLLHLKDGRVLEGRVTEETATHITFETMIANIRVVERVPRAAVKSLEEKELPEGFFDSRRGSRDSSDRETERRRPTAERAGRASSGESKTGYIVVPIKGTVGEEVTATGVRNALDAASKRQLRHVVFQIDSPGGYVYEAKAILDVLAEFDEALVYHAFIEKGAISAACVFAAGADHIYAKPDATLGGALAFSQDETSGNTQVDSKFNSIWGAELAARADAKGHPGDVFRAMAVPSVSVWLSPDGDFSLAETPGARRIDDTRSVATLRASEMRDGGLAQILEGPGEIGELRDIEGWREIPRVGSTPMRTAARNRQRLIRDAEALARQITTTVEAAVDADPLSGRHTYRIDSSSGNFVSGSMTSWRMNCDAATKQWSRVLDLLHEQARMNDRAERAGAIHLVFDPEQADILFRQADERLAWLSENRLRMSPP